MKLYVKYMISQSCITLVQKKLKEMVITYVVIEPGLIEILEDITPKQREELEVNLKQSGIELLDDKKSNLVESIEKVIIEMVHYSDKEPKTNYADFISKRLGYNYTYLANVFSKVKGITIQQFVILHKIEKVKELILYDQLSLKEIARRMHYSSAAHLSNQFKKITGLTPTFYKGIANKRRKNIEDV